MLVVVLAVLALVTAFFVLILSAVMLVMNPVVGLVVLTPFVAALWWGLRRASAGVRLRHAMQIKPFDPKQRY